MLSVEEMKTYLKANLMEKRYSHTLGVAETAKKLAKLNGTLIFFDYETIFGT